MTQSTNISNASSVFGGAFACVGGGGGEGGGGEAIIDYSTLKVTVPASNVDADLTDFPLVIEHKAGSGGIPAEWFAEAAAGTISVETEGGTKLQTEVAYFDADKGVLRVHVKTDLSSSVDNVFILFAAKAPTVTGTVFSAYELVVPVGYADDIETITDFSPNDYSGSASWSHTTSGVHPVFNGDGNGLSVLNTNLYTDDISIADDLYLIADVEYGNIGTYTAAGLSDGTGTMDGVMLRNFSTYGRVASYSDGAGGWLECDNTGSIADRGVGERFVGSLKYESGVGRDIFADGIAKGTDASVQDPFPTKTRCTIGCRDSLTEDLIGKVFEVRAAGFIPSDAWVKAEALNMGDNEFYSITSTSEECNCEGGGSEPTVPANYLGFGDYNDVVMEPPVDQDDYTRLTIESVTDLCGNDYDWIEDFGVVCPYAGNLTDPELYWLRGGDATSSTNDLQAQSTNNPEVLAFQESVILNGESSTVALKPAGANWTTGDTTLSLRGNPKKFHELTANVQKVITPLFAVGVPANHLGEIFRYEVQAAEDGLNLSIKMIGTGGSGDLDMGAQKNGTPATFDTTSDWKKEAASGNSTETINWTGVSEGDVYYIFVARRDNYSGTLTIEAQVT